MDKSLKVFKFQLKESIKPTIIFYGIFLFVMLTLVYLSENTNGSVSSSGIELSTAIFLFVCGLNSFKSQFYLAQGNNISRKSFLKGTVLYGFAFSGILPVVDIIINRGFNLVIPCPMNYDMMYGSIRTMSFTQGMSSFVVNNSIQTLMGTYMFTTAAYVFVFMLGLVMTMLMFKLNKIGKLIFWGSGAVLFIYTNLVSLIPNSFWVFVQNAFGWNTRNPYAGVLSLILLSFVLILGQYLLIRKAEADKNL